MFSTLQESSAVDAAALQNRLRNLSSLPTTGPSARPLPPSPPSTESITPPPDFEAEANYYKVSEEEARKFLEQDGCPPCYTHEPSYSTRYFSEEYKEINLYWETWPYDSDGGVLSTQREDWRNFRSFQEKTRRYYIQRFDRFIEAARERRRRHRLVPEVRFNPNPNEQTRVETWVEFQNYHLHYQEGLEKRVEVESQGLRTAERNLEGAVDHELDHAIHDKNAYSYRLATATQKMKLHEKHILPWIEQQRINMVAAVDDFSDISNTSVSGVRRRKPGVRSVLKPIRSAVSKPDQRRRSPRIQRSKPSPISEDPTSAFDTSQNTKSQMPHVRKSKRQKTKEDAPLRPLHPQKVTKLIQESRKPIGQAEKDIQTHRATQSRSNHKRRPPRLWFTQQHLSEGYVTRSGRTSRRRELLGIIS